MKRTVCLSLTLSIFSLMTLRGFAEACEIPVYTTNSTNAQKSVTVTLNSNGTQADIANFNLAAGAAHSETLVLGPRSLTGMSLNAQVSGGTLSASCQFALPQCQNMSLLIETKKPETCVVTPPPPAEEDLCKHDNGNHWGEYRKLGMTPAPHSGKPNATKPCKGNKVSSKPTQVNPPQTCPTEFTCTFVGPG